MALQQMTLPPAARPEAEPTPRRSARRKAAAAAAVTVLAAGAVQLPAANAGASGYPNQVTFAWYVQAVGPMAGCGHTEYGTVRGIQAMLWAAGAYGTPSSSNKNQIDGIWGPATTQAVKNYQTSKSLAVDGCAGWNTTSRMRNQWNRISDVVGLAGHVSHRYYYDNGSGVAIRQVRDMYSFGCYWFDAGGWHSYDPWQTSAGYSATECPDGVGGSYSGPLWSW